MTVRPLMTSLVSTMLTFYVGYMVFLFVAASQADTQITAHLHDSLTNPEELRSLIAELKQLQDRYFRQGLDLVMTIWATLKNLDEILYQLTSNEPLITIPV